MSFSVSQVEQFVNSLTAQEMSMFNRLSEPEKVKVINALVSVRSRDHIGVEDPLVSVSGGSESSVAKSSPEKEQGEMILSPW